MTRGIPLIIDPKMFGDATPEDVARALLRPRRVAQPVVRDEVAVQKPTADEASGGVAHLDDGV